MCRTECLLAVFALLAGLVNSWDIALTTGDQLEFYTNQTKTSIDSGRFKELTALAYDAVHNMLLFVDKQNDNASIFSYHLETKKYQSLVRRRSNENIQGIAFDPVKGKLFWTDTNERSIFWISLMPGSKNNIYGNLLFTFNDQMPRAIAVDSCRGYIYWTNTNVTKASIERAKFDGSERQAIVNTDVYMPVSIAIDQKNKRLYWADDKEGIHFSVESSDLEGKDRTTLMTGTYHQPNALTITKDSIYWIDWGYKSIWKLNKDKDHAEPEEYMKFSNEVPFGIVGNYPTIDQIQEVPECEALLSLSRNKTAINDSFNIPKDVGLFCLHGVKVEGKLLCKCTPGYTGERCEMSVCHNYCLNGDCNVTNQGEATCSCKKGYKGTKCEIDICNDYCLNNGTCSVSDDKNPLCQCPNGYEGQRCEMPKTLATAATICNTSKSPKCDNYCLNDGKCTVTDKQGPKCECTKNYEGQRCETPKSTPVDKCNCTQTTNGDLSTAYLPTSALTDSDFVDCNQSWDNVRDPVIVVLGVLSGLLCVACTFLVTRVLHLKKRPRIKKRIIVNKNVTPMTARPDQCEITIENCCNMNICETPCFEPRSTIRPTLGDAKPGKEEKVNLISNMELPEDY